MQWFLGSLDPMGLNPQVHRWCYTLCKVRRGCSATTLFTALLFGIVTGFTVAVPHSTEAKLLLD